MAGMTTANSQALIRSELWTGELKDVLTDELNAQGYVRWLDNFPDGSQMTIPSIGTLDADNYSEDQPVRYQALDTGEFNFSITEYKSAATYITAKNRQDSFYASELEASFIPKMSRAIKEDLEQFILKLGQPGTPGGHTAGNMNAINGAAHRFVGSNVINSKQTLGPADFARARYSLKKANVPDQALIAIVDPSVEYYLNTSTQLVNVSNNKAWEGIIADGIGSGMRFVKNVYGFDVYTSNYLPVCGTNQSGASETIQSVASGANAVANLFFSAAPDVVPFVGAWRQMPKVDGEWNKDFQREEYVTTCRYGAKLFRPENFLTILNDPSAVS